ncbi:hypothetical protein F5Y06DRAFT_263451 [Hypoxylon sp. FL0890]|nr:hypothetical protein F5Y06DRAFT_263451 [Hypoxylon sp. FL0890]
MDGSPVFFGNSIQDDDEGCELFDGQDMKEESDDCQDTLFNADSNGHPTNVPPVQTHPSNTTPMDSVHLQVSRRPTQANTRNKSEISVSSSVQAESLGSTSRSSELSDSRSSQPTSMSEGAAADLDGEPNDVFKNNSILSPNAPHNKRRRHRKQQVIGNIDERLDTAKRKKFLEKNRVAATKCRQKKKEWVSDLEEARFGLESQHNHLRLEYSNLRNEITQIKSQLMEHATCNDHNIDKWIENEAKRFVLKASERYDQMLADLGHAPGLVSRHGSGSSASGYPVVTDSELINPVTESQRGSTSYPPGAFMSNSPIFSRRELTSNLPEPTVSTPAEEPYPPGALPTSMTEGVSFEGVSMANDALQAVTITQS